MLSGYSYLCWFIGYKMSWLINPTQLDKFRKTQKNLIILDASWHLPETQRHAKQEFLASHILEAYFLDLAIFHDPAAPAPNMLLLDEQILSEKLSQLGIRNDYKIILYDNSELHSACRALWMFRIFGHNPHQLYVLNGGYAAWQRYNGKTATGEAHTKAKNYTVKLQLQLLRTLNQIKQNVQRPIEQLVDLRHPVRFAGGPDPRPATRAGHIPWSINFPYTRFFEPDGRFTSLEKIRKYLTDIGIDLTAPIITTCGSGMTAPILNFILDLMNYPQQALYDGSWSEWGNEKLYPGEVSLAERPVQTCLIEQ